MPQVQCWECPRTGKLFKSKSLYSRHLQNLAKRSRKQKAKQKLIDAHDAWYASAIEECACVEDVRMFFLKHFDRLHAYYASIKPLAEKKPVKLLTVDFIRMNYRDLASNSHSAPKGKSRNWSREPHKPFGYPGYVGRIEYTYRSGKGYGSVDSDFWSFYGINTGSGGGNSSGSRGYSVTLFCDDFAGVGQEAVMMRLRGN